jgi:hypothetical protein
MIKDTILITIGQLSKIRERVYDATASLQPEKAVIIKNNVQLLTTNVITQSFE